MQLGEWAGTGSKVKEQQWIYDVPEKALQSRGGIGGVLFEGFNKKTLYIWHSFFLNNVSFFRRQLDKIRSTITLLFLKRKEKSFVKILCY